MKYYLALDKGQNNYSTKRFTIVDLTSLNPCLGQDKNLEAIYQFTTKFSSSIELKKFLQANGLITAKESMYSLVITYHLKYSRVMPVAYACDLEFFDISHLADIIYKNSKRKNFLPQLIRAYHSNKALAGELYSFQVYLHNPYADYKFYDVVRQFVNKVCFRMRDKREVKDFKGLYDLALLVAKLTNSGRDYVINAAPLNERKYEEGTPEYYEQIEQSNDELEGQMRLY